MAFVRVSMVAAKLHNAFPPMVEQPSASSVAPQLLQVEVDLQNPVTIRGGARLPFLAQAVSSDEADGLQTIKRYPNQSESRVVGASVTCFKFAEIRMPHVC